MPRCRSGCLRLADGEEMNPTHTSPRTQQKLSRLPRPSLSPRPTRRDQPFSPTPTSACLPHPSTDAGHDQAQKNIAATVNPEEVWRFCPAVAAVNSRHQRRGSAMSLREPCATGNERPPRVARQRPEQIAIAIAAAGRTAAARAEGRSRAAGRVAPAASWHYAKHVSGYLT